MKKFLKIMEFMTTKEAVKELLEELERPDLTEEEKKQIKYVYTTNNGKKYHRKNCTYLKDSCIEISLDSAIKQGFEPCKKCNP